MVTADGLLQSLKAYDLYRRRILPEFSHERHPANGEYSATSSLLHLVVSSLILLEIRELERVKYKALFAP
jgi:hypothetical protein